MKRKTLLILLFIFSGFIVNAQNQANIWYFGFNCGLDFNSGVPVNTHEIHLAGAFNNAVMCDTNGDFLFYFNAEWALNREGSIMANGLDFIGDRHATLGALIVQKPGSDHLYYLFTVDFDAPFQPTLGMHYSIVDMNLDGGLGAVTSEKNIPLADAWAACNKLLAVRHENGEDVWILTRNFKTDQYYATFLLTASGIETQAVLSLVPWRNDNNCTGSMKVTHNKKYLAAAYEINETTNDYEQSIDLCKFNSSTGKIDLLFTISKNPNNWTNKYYPRAVEFSPDSKLLYVTYANHHMEGAPMELYQYDMQYIEDSLLFKESERFIARGPTQGLQLARDGKIYCTVPRFGYSDYVSVIHEPWKRGTACNYEADAHYLDGHKTNQYLPNMLLDHLFRFEWEGDCAHHPIAFQPNFLPDMVSILWNFGDLQTSTELRPVHFYENGGEYEVHVTVTYQNGRVEETSRVITVLDSPKPDLGPDQLICEGEETVLTAGSDTGFYAWSTGSIGDNVFSITVSDSGTYWVKVTNSLGCSLSDTIHVG